MDLRNGIAVALSVVAVLSACSGGSDSYWMYDCYPTDLGSDTLCRCQAIRHIDGRPNLEQRYDCTVDIGPSAICCASVASWPDLSQADTTVEQDCMCAPSTSGTCPQPNGYSSLVYQVDTCVVPSSDYHDPGSSSGGDAGSGGDSGGGTCSGQGSCGPDTNDCTCGTECVHYGPGEYMCGFTCATNDNCTSQKDPVTKKPYTACHPGLQTDTADYDGYCVFD